MDEVEQIKERLDIVDVISSYLTLKKAGANMKAPCPFHNEKTPSFMVSPERQTFKCFGCGEGGDVFTFIEKMEGVDFYNALKILADRAGVKLQNKSVRYGEKEFKSDRKTRIFEINDWAKKLFHKILIDHPKAVHAREYVQKRGMNDETIKKFEIGYAPDSWDLLTKFLKGKGYSIEEIVQAGVAIRNDRGDCYDRFRGRIMFPINNIMGLTVAFTSRIIKDDPKQAKYINSAESPIYIKGKTIYGLDKAKMAIKEADLAVFVEGNMDVIACHQVGFKNVVATSGTAITEDQIKILSRYASEIAFSFDTDTAGEAAMKKAIRIALQNDINSKIIALSGPFKDPDEAIKADPKNWQRAVENGKPALEYWIDLLIRKEPSLSVTSRKKIAKEILPIIKIIFSDIEKEHYIKYLATKLSVSEKALIDALLKTKNDQNNSTVVKEENNAKPKKLALIDKIFAMIWYDNSLAEKIDTELLKNIQIPESLRPFLEQLRNKIVEKDKLPSATSLLLDQYALDIAAEFKDDKDAFSQEYNFLVGRLRSDQREDIREEFAIKIKQAEEKGDKGEIKRLLSQFSDLIK